MNNKSNKTNNTNNLKLYTITNKKAFIIHHDNTYYTKLKYHNIVKDIVYYLGDYCNSNDRIILRGYYILYDNYYILHGNAMLYTLNDTILSECVYEYGVKIYGKDYYYNTSNLIKYEGEYYNEKMHGLGIIYNRKGDYIEMNFNNNIPYGAGLYYNSETTKIKVIEVNKKEWYNIIHNLEWDEIFNYNDILI